MLGKLILLVTTNKLVPTKDFYNLYHIQMLTYLDIQQFSRVDNKLVFNLRKIELQMFQDPFFLLKLSLSFHKPGHKYWPDYSYFSLYFLHFRLVKGKDKKDTTLSLISMDFALSTNLQGEHQFRRAVSVFGLEIVLKLNCTVSQVTYFLVYFLNMRKVKSTKRVCKFHQMNIVQVPQTT